MSFSVSWVYKAIDEFTPITKKIGKSVVDLGKKLTALDRKLKKTTSAIKKFKMAGQGLIIISGQGGASLDRLDVKLRNVNTDIRTTAKNIRSIDIATKNLNRNTNRSIVNLDKFNSRLKASRQHLNAMSGRMKAAVVGVIGGGVIAKTLSTFTGFEDRLLDLSAITGATGKDLDFLKQSSFELGAAAAVMGSDVLEGFKLVASAKPELLKNLPMLKSVTEQVLLLANASGLDMAQSAKVTAESLNIFGQRAEEASRFVNILAAGAKFGSSEVADTGEAVLKAGAAARLSGLKFEEFNAVIQGVAISGLKGAVAGTGLQAIFTKLEASGIPAFSIEVRGLTAVLDTLAEMELTAAQQVKLYGLENKKTAAAMLIAKERIKELTVKLTDTSIATEQANIRLSGLSATFRRLGAIIEKRVVKAMERFKPTIQANIVAFKNWIESISDDSIADFVDTLKIMASILVAIVKTVDLLVRGFKLVGTFIGETIAGVVVGDIGVSRVSIPGGGSIPTLDFSSGKFDASRLWDQADIIRARFWAAMGDDSLTKALSATSKENNIEDMKRRIDAMPEPETPATVNPVQMKGSIDVNLGVTGTNATVDSVNANSTGMANLNLGRNIAAG